MTELRLALLIGALVTAAVVVPFTALSGIERITGAFVFWTFFALIVIAVIARSVRTWKDQP
jgi:hypothetical protein